MWPGARSTWKRIPASSSGPAVGSSTTSSGSVNVSPPNSCCPTASASPLPGSDSRSRSSGCTYAGTSCAPHTGTTDHMWSMWPCVSSTATGLSRCSRSRSSTPLTASWPGSMTTHSDPRGRRDDVAVGAERAGREPADEHGRPLDGRIDGCRSRPYRRGRRGPRTRLVPTLPAGQTRTTSSSRRTTRGQQQAREGAGPACGPSARRPAAPRRPRSASSAPPSIASTVAVLAVRRRGRLPWRPREAATTRPTTAVAAGAAPRAHACDRGPVHVHAGRGREPPGHRRRRPRPR